MLTNTYLLTFQDQGPNIPHWILRRSRDPAYYKTSTNVESLQPKTFMMESVWLMFHVLPPLALCAYIMWTWMTARHIFKELWKCAKCINQEPEKPFDPLRWHSWLKLSWKGNKLCIVLFHPCFVRVSITWVHSLIWAKAINSKPFSPDFVLQSFEIIHGPRSLGCASLHLFMADAQNMACGLPFKSGSQTEALLCFKNVSVKYKFHYTQLRGSRRIKC